MNHLANNEIELRLVKDAPANPAKEWLRSLHYDIVHRESRNTVGRVVLRVGYTMSIVRYGGHIGYGVNPAWRGHHYAGKACKLLANVAVDHGMDVLWITCNPDNWPSRKTCEWLGATLVEVVDLPSDNDQYKIGERQKCRYRWLLY